MRYLFIAFLFISSFLSGQGIEPTSLQPTPYKSGILKGVTPFVDEFTGDTMYIYQHVDSLVFVKDSIFVRNDSIFLRDGTGFAIVTDSIYVVSGATKDTIKLRDGGGYVLMTKGNITKVTGTSPIIIADTTNTPNVTIQNATTSQTGALTSTDWNMFSSINLVNEVGIGNTDWNTSILGNRMKHYFGNNNAPAGENFMYGYFSGTPSVSNYGVQLATSDANNTYTRYLDNGTWGSWKLLVSTTASADNLPRLDVAGKVLIQSSLTDNGSYLENTSHFRINPASGADSYIFFKSGGTNNALFGNEVGIWGTNNGSMSMFVYGNNSYNISTNSAKRLNINGSGVVNISNLAGSGTRMVTANSSGDLATQAIPTNTDSIYVRNDSIFLRDGTGFAIVTNTDPADSTIVQNSYGTIITESPANTFNIEVDSTKFATPYDLTLIPNPPDSTVIVGGYGIDVVESPANTFTVEVDTSQVATPYDLTLKENVLSFTSPLSRSTNTISIPAASTSVSGHLTSTDWNTFSNINLVNEVGTGNTDWNTSILGNRMKHYFGNTNGPAGENFMYGYFSGRPSVSNYGVQLATSDANNTYTRYLDNGTWGSWKLLVSTTASADNLPRLDVAGKVLIQSSLTDNGSYLENTSHFRINPASGADSYIFFKSGGTNNALFGNEVGIWGTNNGSMSMFVYGNNSYNISTNSAKRLNINGSGVVNISNLAGSGTRMVTANSSGDLATQSIPIGMSSWNFSVNGGAAYNMGDGWNQNFANGTGISWSRSGQTLTATNTGDLSNTNELQTLSFSSPNLSISGSGGNSVALPVLPSGSTNQTLRHDGSSWSSTSGVTVTSGNRMDINSWPGTVNLGSKLLVNGHIQYTNTGFAATTLTGRDGDGGLTSVGLSGLSLTSGTLSATDASASNEGTITVGAGSSTTSIISSNTSGSTPITLSAGNGLIISEPGSNTVALDKYREYAHVYGNGSQNITTTPSNVQILQGDVTPVNMTVNTSSDRINTAGAIYTVAYKWTVFGTIYNSSTTPSEVRVSMLRNGIVSYTYDEIDITCGQGNTNFSMSGISGGSANFGWQVAAAPIIGVLQLNNFHATVERL